MCVCDEIESKMARERKQEGEREREKETIDLKNSYLPVPSHTWDPPLLRP